MPVFNIHHVTKYEYDRPVKESVNEIKIYPVPGTEQEVLYHDLNVTDNPEIMIINDYWGNKLGMFNIITPHQQLIIESKLIVRTLHSGSPPRDRNGSFEQLNDEVNNNLTLLELCCIEDPSLTGDINSMVTGIASPGNTVTAFVYACSNYIYNQFRYIKGITNIQTTLEEILQLRSGVCQDFAHIMLEMLRNAHIPCRYVSGYICPNQNGMRGEGATHAWAEAWIPGAGWTGIDPTNNVWASGHHVKLATGRNFNDCTPVKGTFKGPAKQSLSVFVSVGYEDGHKFEDITKVKMEKMSEDNTDPDILASFAGQQ
jgi:transglutaminase-like putative cysteine protease